MGILHKLAGWSALVSLLASGAIAAEDKPRLALSPKSNWVLDYADENCGLRRIFGNDQIELLFELNATLPGHAYRLLMVSHQLKVRRANPHIGFEPGPEPIEHVQASTVTMGDGRRGYLSEISVLTPEDYDVAAATFSPGKSYHNFWLEKVEAREKAITGVGVNKGFDRDFFLEIDQFHKAMAAMRACQDDLVKSWGLDPETLKTLSRPPMPEDYEALAREVQEIYPWRMRGIGWQAVIRVRLTVGPDGRPNECHVRADGQKDDFTKTACEILMDKARFEPALDANGNPVSSLWTTRIIYQLR